MNAKRRLLFGACVFLSMGAAPPSGANDLAAALRPISGPITSSPQIVARSNVLALNTAMFSFYDNAARIYQRHILSQHPVILGLFSGSGGRLVLYRPGMEAIEAPSVPLT